MARQPGEAGALSCVPFKRVDLSLMLSLLRFLGQVVKADLAGWLGNPGKRARSFLWPVIFATSGSFLSRVVRAAVVLREHVRSFMSNHEVPKS